MVSSCFERIIQKELSSYRDEFSSFYLREYQRGFKTQFALLSLIEKLTLKDLSETLDKVNHELLIAKLYAYGFSKDVLN